MAHYLSKETILSVYKNLSKIYPSQTQGAIQIVSSIRYFVALDRFYELTGHECDVRNKADKDLFTKCVGDVVDICDGLYANWFFYPLKEHNGDYCVGSNFYSANVVVQSLEQTNRVYTFPKSRTAPLFSVQNGKLKKEKAYYSNFSLLLANNNNKVALALWLLRDLAIIPDAVFYNSIKKTFRSYYSKELTEVLIPEENVFEKICYDNGYYGLSSHKCILRASDIESIFVTKEKESVEDSALVKLRDLATIINSSLPDTLLDAVKKMHPKSFEILIKKLLNAMRFGETEDDVVVTQYVGDYGIDGYVRKDKLGVEKICVYQAKRYTENNVSSPEVNSLGGAMINHGTKCGIFVTTTDFTPNAKKYNPQGYTIIFINGKELVNYLIEYGIAVKTETIEIKSVDNEYLNKLS